MARPGAQFYPDPLDKGVYVFDWTAWLGGATIASQTTVISPTGTATLDNNSIITANTQVRVRVLGAVLGTKYKITNRVVTSETPTREKEESYFVKGTDK